MYVVVFSALICISSAIIRLTRYRYGGPLPGSMQSFFMDRAVENENCTRVIGTDLAERKRD